MTQQSLPSPSKTYLATAALLAGATLLIGAPPDPADKAAAEQARRDAEQVIRGIEMEMLSGKEWTKVERIEKPLLFYSDPTRNDDRGSVWGWAAKGRPVALIEFYRGATFREGWTFAICNTSGRKLRAHREGALWWHENDSAVELKDIPGAPVPAAEAPVRQRQLKRLAQKFAAHEIFDPESTRYDLRLLDRPLHTYRDEANGILDGGVFTLAHGTNPEVMLFVEARVDPKDSSKRVWQYLVGRSANAEFHLEYNGKEVFAAPPAGGVIGVDKPYWFGHINAAPAKP